MTSPTGPGNPPRPRVHPSELEQDNQLIQAVLEKVDDNSTRKAIGLNNIIDTLHSVDLDIDDAGFIIQQETGERATPYAYSPQAFHETDSPVDNVFEAYYRPEEDVTACILSKGEIHLSDLHSIVRLEHGSYPVRDDGIPLRNMIAETGIAFLTITLWSDAFDIAHSDEHPDVIVDHPGLGSDPVTISCLRCQFTGEPEDWDGDSDDPECPDCGGLWDSRGLETCTECETTHWWEDLDHGGYYGTPSCPDCGTGVESLESTTRYD